MLLELAPTPLLSANIYDGFLIQGLRFMLVHTVRTRGYSSPDFPGLLLVDLSPESGGFSAPPQYGKMWHTLTRKHRVHQNSTIGVLTNVQAKRNFVNLYHNLIQHMRYL